MQAINVVSIVLDLYIYMNMDFMKNHISVFSSNVGSKYRVCGECADGINDKAMVKGAGGAGNQYEYTVFSHAA